MSLISYAQNLEDVMLWRALRDVGQGFYIDVGAWRPREDSVTLAFYEHGWSGINVEPDTVGYAAMAEARPRDINLQLALGEEAGEATFFRIGETGLSTLDPEFARQHQVAGHKVERHQVEVSTLALVCEQHVRSAIHFLKIDAEGAEAEVLRGADFVRFRPWIVLVEATLPNSPEPSHEAWEGTLLEAGYVFAWFDGLNRFYVAREKAEALLPRFREPPNVFDDYVSIAAIRKAVAAEGHGTTIAELEASATAEQARAAAEASRQELQRSREEAREAEARLLAKAVAAEDAAREAEARWQARAAEAEDAARQAQARALEAETQRLLAEAELTAQPAQANAEVTLAGGANRATQARVASPARTKGPRVFFDASLTLYYGMRTPVGIVRAEHYVAEFLAHAPDVPLDFVIFDGELRAYRPLQPSERRLLRRILFERYAADQATAMDLGQDPLPEADADEADDADDAAQDNKAPEVSVLPRPEPPLPEPEAPNLSPGQLLRRRLRSATRLRPQDFNTILIRDAARLLPVRPDQSGLRRLGTRILRRIGLHTARGGHAVLFRGASALGHAARLGRSAVRPDNPPPGMDETLEEAAAADAPTEAAAIEAAAEAVQEAPVPEGAMRFRPGDVVLSMSNTWDYMDYGYLSRICGRDGVRFVAVIYDVIAMRHPYTTPNDPHMYQRHWVEIGHLAAQLVSISEHSTDTYRRYVAEPNDLDPPIVHAYLPNFLKARAAEIGEVAIPELDGESFAFFCSTIETRKNHQLLFHAWDRLVEERGIDAVPTLVFVGKWGWGTETVRLLVERNWRWRKRLLVLDQVSDAQLIWLYRHARFTLFPSISEGFGLAAAESLSFGTPVVVSSCPALVEASEGLMPAIDPFDLPAWVDEIRSLIVDDTRLDALREAAGRYRGPAYEDFGQVVHDTVLRLAFPDGVPAAGAAASSGGASDPVRNG
ncbi:FkbM family methyltransferase [Roseomonas elaeocarpi]|uniref:FkbM family methyltransferase n=1 Tax=Roseomonas elaeocarpi TaxID=907779 RepID=A0ABV6JZ65_9PROT